MANFHRLLRLLLLLFTLSGLLAGSCFFAYLETAAITLELVSYLFILIAQSGKQRQIFGYWSCECAIEWNFLFIS